MASETGKQRSQRIEIDYFRKRTDLHSWRTICIVVGLVAAATYAAYVIASGGGSHVSTGEISVSHASFENDCAQCHQDFTPIDSQASKLDLSLIGIQASESIARLESACQHCHQVGDHYRDTMISSAKLNDQNCAICHADHQGRNHDLVSVKNDKCASCHADLSASCSATPRVRPSIVDFSQANQDGVGHGDFASLNNGDPGVVKFDHKQHMLPGQVNSGERGALTISMLDATMQERYRRAGQSDDSPVQLDCGSCHQFAGNPTLSGQREAENTLIADAELGRYVAPISFDQHCSACHSMNPGVATENTTPIPHAASWRRVELLLAASISGASKSGQTRIERDDRNRSPQPGDGLGTMPAADVASSLSKNAEIKQARVAIQANCLECHDDASIRDEAIAEAASGKADPMIPARWLTRGLYDHGAHRKIDCRFCHDEAYPDGAIETNEPPMDHETVMIGGIETCNGCHRPAGSPTPTELIEPTTLEMLGGSSTWASDSCTTCHRYHTPLTGESIDMPATAVAVSGAQP